MKKDTLAACPRQLVMSKELCLADDSWLQLNWGYPSDFGTQAKSALQHPIMLSTRLLHISYKNINGN